MSNMLYPMIVSMRCDSQIYLIPCPDEITRKVQWRFNIKGDFFQPVHSIPETMPASIGYYAGDFVWLSEEGLSFPARNGNAVHYPIVAEKDPIRVKPAWIVPNESDPRKANFRDFAVPYRSRGKVNLSREIYLDVEVSGASYHAIAPKCSPCSVVGGDMYSLELIVAGVIPTTHQEGRIIKAILRSDSKPAYRLNGNEVYVGGLYGIADNLSTFLSTDGNHFSLDLNKLREEFYGISDVSQLNSVLLISDETAQSEQFFPKYRISLLAPFPTTCHTNMDESGVMKIIQSWAQEKIKAGDAPIILTNNHMTSFLQSWMSEIGYDGLELIEKKIRIPTSSHE